MLCVLLFFSFSSLAMRQKAAVEFGGFAVLTFVLRLLSQKNRSFRTSARPADPRPEISVAAAPFQGLAISTRTLLQNSKLNTTKGQGKGFAHGVDGRISWLAQSWAQLCANHEILPSTLSQVAD